MTGFIRYVWEELARNDVTYEPADWYRRGNALLAHAMLAVLVALPIYLALPLMLAEVVVTILVAVYFMKEWNDVRDGGQFVLLDSILDTSAVVAGTVIASSIVHPSGFFVVLPILAIAVMWVGYPLSAYLEDIG
jgi:glucan phosphoethanolaminetransferase (alkaline phosphatase superfamily)